MRSCHGTIAENCNLLCISRVPKWKKKILVCGSFKAYLLVKVSRGFLHQSPWCWWAAWPECIWAKADCCPWAAAQKQPRHSVHLTWMRLLERSCSLQLEFGILALMSLVVQALGLCVRAAAFCASLRQIRNMTGMDMLCFAKYNICIFWILQWFEYLKL